MRLLPLLFDPRGVIDRRAFWSGLIQLTIVSLAVYAGLTLVDGDVAWAALPAVGEAFVTVVIASHAHGAALSDVSLMAGIFLVAARLYATACLVLKRSRGAGGGSGMVVAFGLAVLLVHVLMGLWAYDLYPEGMAVIVPMVVDMMANALIGAVFVVWIGARPARSVVFTVARENVRCAG
ncbi:hypothetical protein [Caulobacter sp.]|uniref:hypothetical protein n=1 Tax=Caulobacter sp. TaxID=78 RepID=UPI003BB03D9E